MIDLSWVFEGKEYEVGDRVVLPVDTEDINKFGKEKSKCCSGFGGVILTESEFKKAYDCWVREGSPCPSKYSNVYRRLVVKKNQEIQALKDELSNSIAESADKTAYSKRLIAQVAQYQNMSFWDRLTFLFFR